MKSKSLAVSTLLKMAIRITAIVVVMIGVGYFHLKNTIEIQTQGNLEKYVTEREARERIIFDEAQQNQETAVREFTDLYKTALSDPGLAQSYKSLVRTYPDGAIRNRDEKFNGQALPGIFIGPQVQVSKKHMARIVAAYEISLRLGVAYHARFQDTYFTFPQDNAIVVYWPEESKWALKAKPDLNLSVEEYANVADPTNNPLKIIAWTGVFFDKVSQVWMLTGSTPIYDGDEFIGSVSHDVLITELIRRSLKDRLAGTTAYIVKADGRLISHPDHLVDIQNAEGKFDIRSTSDKKLNDQFALISKKNYSYVLSDNDDNFLAVAKIPGPDWFLVSEYPKSLIRTSALESMGFLLIAALVSLITELVVLYAILQRAISKPLLELVHSTKTIADGNYSFDIHVADNRNDELGLLADSFSEMAKAIQERDLALARHAEELENTVLVRTAELDRQKSISAHASKLSALGEMAGGMAHEINTPLATIKLLTSQAQQEVAGDIPDLETLGNHLANIDKTVDRVGKIVKSLKTFARDGGADPFELTNMETVFDDTINLCKERCKLHGIELDVSLPSEAVYISCRAVQLCQVLLNLVNNAHDAVENLPEKWIEVKLVEFLDNIEIRVTDSGSGIPPELREKVFNPFFTTKGVGKGTGMGLSISHGIIRAHKGEFFIDELCQHTCFVLSLPKPLQQVA
jgi:two-component system NtrC family sensor kinase